MRRTSLAVICFCSLVFKQNIYAISYEQPTPTKWERAEKQLFDAAECNLKADAEDPDTNHLISVNGGEIEHYPPPGKPFSIFGLKVKKMTFYHDRNKIKPDRYISHVHASMNTVKTKTNIDQPKETSVGVLSLRYGDSPGVVDIVCTVNK